MSTPFFLLSVVVCNVTLRIVQFKGRHWLLAEDLARLFGYTSLQTPPDDVCLHGSELVKIDGKGHARRIYAEGAVRGICRLVERHSIHSRPGVKALLDWLEEGDGLLGHNTSEVRPLSSIEAPRTLRLVPRGPDPMQQLLEREKAYCRDLVKTFLRYCESEDVDKLTGMVDGQIDNLLEQRYCPGLNAARYELYRKYWLQGGGV